MGTATAISAVAITQSTIAINSAKDAECKFLLQNFDSLKNPTVTEQREYANCVHRIYGNGEPMPSDVAVVIKVAILIVFAFFFFGMWKEKSEHSRSDFVDVFMSGMLWALLSVIAMFLIGLIIAAITFLVS